MDNFLVLFHAVSAGQNGPDLGSDEEQIVVLLYAIVDVKANKVSFNFSLFTYFEFVKRPKKCPISLQNMIGEFRI